MSSYVRVNHKGKHNSSHIIGLHSVSSEFNQYVILEVLEGSHIRLNALQSLFV